MATTKNKIYKFVGEENVGSVVSSTSFPEILEEQCHELKSSEIREGTGLILNFKNKFIWNFVFFFEMTCFFLFDLPLQTILKNNAKNFWKLIRQNIACSNIDIFI